MRHAWMAALCLLLLSIWPNITRADTPYRVDDLLALESIGQVMIDPSERFVVVERRRRYDSASDYAYGSFQNRALSNILVTSLDRPRALQPLIDQDPDAGYWMGSFSPSGKRLSVFRLSHRRLDLGVVDMATRTVKWLDVIPDLPIAHPAPSWIDDDHMVVVAFETRRLPFILSLGNAVQTELPSLWQTMASGKLPSATVADTKTVSSFANGRKVLRLDLITGRSEVVARGAITDVAVSRRGYMAVVSIVAPVKPPVDTPIDPAFVSLRHALDVVRIGKIPVRTHISDDILPAMMAWNDAGKKLVYVARAGTRDWRSARYQIAMIGTSGTSIQTIDAPPTITGKQSSIVAHARWLGRLLLLQVRGGNDAADWVVIDPASSRMPTTSLGQGMLAHATRGAVWFRSGNALTRVALSGKQGNVVKSVVSTGTSSFDPSSTGVRLLDNPVSTTVPIVRDVGGSRYVTMLGANRTRRVVVAVSSKLLAATRHHAVTFGEDAHGVGSLALSSSTGSSAILMQTNAYLAARALPRIVEIKSRLTDGRDHSHWLFLPVSANPKRLPPLVVMQYPGMVLDGGVPSTTSPAFFLPSNDLAILVGHGFAVLMPSLPTSIGSADPLSALAADMDSALDATVAHHLIDPDRIAVLGHSFGGYGAMALATRSTRYRSIVAISGPYDLAAAHGAIAGSDRIRLEFGLPLGQDAGWAEGGQANMVVPPWTDPKRYVEQSPSFALDRIRTPVLLIHGETDVVSVEQAERAFMGLVRLGKDATLVRYWGEGHVLASPANIRDYWGRILSWLDSRFSAVPTKGNINNATATIGMHQAASQ